MIVFRTAFAPEVVLRLEPNFLLGEVLASGLLALGANPCISKADLRSTRESAGRQAAKAGRDGKDSVITISADASATHQAVIAVMEAGRCQGLTQTAFASQSTAQAGA